MFLSGNNLLLEQVYNKKYIYIYIYTNILDHPKIQKYKYAKIFKKEVKPMV